MTRTDLWLIRLAILSSFAMLGFVTVSLWEVFYG